MLNRRLFLVTATGLTISSFLTGCSQEVDFKILLLQGSLPLQLITAFRKHLNQSKAFIFKPESKLTDLFSLLQTWHKKNQPSQKNAILNANLFAKKEEEIAQLVTLSNYWLNQAIQEQLIEPFAEKNIPNWNKIPPAFINLVTRNDQGNLDDQGQVWGVPYRWGTTMIVYRKDEFKKLGWNPTDWSDLWREEIKGHLSLLNQPREIIGLTLKKLGYSYNTTNLDNIPQLKSELIKLHQQVKFYDSTNYLQPLILGDTWLAVGWSSDILSILKRYPNLEAVIPKSGTSLWSDLWVKPRGSKPNLELLNQWLNFSFQPTSANQISLFTNASSPLLFTMDQAEIIPDVRQNPLIYPPQNLLNNSEFIIPFTEEIQTKYEQLWQEIVS